MPENAPDQFITQDRRPVPDPTLLTSQLVREAEARLEKVVNLQFIAIGLEIEGLRKSIVDRFTAVDNRYDIQTKTSEKAVNAALLAADQALLKSVTLTDAKLATQSVEVGSLREMLNERYQTQTKALDAAFVAQQAAVATSFDASEKAMAAALLAAKEAVDKAAVSTEKRFDTVAVQVADLNASLAQLLPRNEAEARMRALDDRLTDIKSTVDKGFTGVDIRQVSTRDSQSDMRSNLGLAISFAGVMIALAVLGVGLLIGR